MSAPEEKKIRYFKPEGFKGRGNSSTYKINRWSITMYDKDTQTIKQGKYPTKEKMIADMSLDISRDQIYQLVSGAKVDTDKKKKASSFLNRYGHIKIEKIKEVAVL